MRAIYINIVRDDGYASKIGLKPKDIIYKINGCPVTYPQQVNDAIALGSAIFSVIRGPKIINFEIKSTSLDVVIGISEFDETEFLRQSAIESVLISSAHFLPGNEIYKIVDFVGAQCVYGVNLFADMAGGIRELVGGRSKALENKIHEARDEVLKELKEKANAVGANAIISTRVDHAEIGDKGGFMLMVTATGTAVCCR